jgi:hypothetical protein
MFLRAFSWIAWLAYLAGCVLILHNSMEDYLPGGYGLFISQKGEIGESAVWRISLYIHIVAGLFCLFAALPQFSRALLTRIPSLHRICGRVYGMSVLLLLCPTGFHLAFYAKGGFLGKLGFLTLSVLAFHSTLTGWRAVMPPVRNMALHRTWMIRSFALAASAITFRIFHMLGYFCGLEENVNYVTCLWLSIFGNLFIAEMILQRGKRSIFFLSYLQPTKPQTEI